MSKIYTVTNVDGTKQDIIADDVLVQTQNQSGDVLYRFTEANPNVTSPNDPNAKITVAYIPADSKTKISSVPNPNPPSRAAAPTVKQ